MKFNSIKEYFYKLYNICYMLTLIPLAVFIYVYMNLQSSRIESFLLDQNYLLPVQVAILAFGFITLTIVHLVIKGKMKTVSREFGLGNKMDKYFNMTMTRIGSGASISVLTGAGLFVTGSELFSLGFLAVLLWMAYHWPTPKKFCAELMLKGDEREMILYKRESL